jgi:O-antigen ligase
MSVTARNPTSQSVVLQAGEAPHNGRAMADPGKLSATLLAIYVFIIASRILDLSSIAHFHIPLILFILVGLFTIGIVLQNGIQGFLDNKASFCFVGLTVWVLVAFPLSRWRAASLPHVQATVQGLVIFAAVVQIGSTFENWRRLAGAFAYAIFTAGLLSFHFGRSVEGRLALGNGTLADPNEFALSLVLGMPFLLYAAALAKPFKRFILYGCLIVLLYCFARAGSRGGLISLAALVLVLFFLGKPAQKLMMISAVVAGILIAGALLPTYLRDRFVTFFSAAHDDASGRLETRLESDVDSAEGRKQLLIQSIQMTFQHPLLGVGPGIFPWEAAKERKQKTGFGGMALVTHNTYTQYSSETGIPGFLFWTGTLIFCIRYAIRVYRRASDIEPKLAHAARDVLASMVALAVGTFFLSLGYGFEIPILLGLTVALYNVANARLAEVRASGPVRSLEPLPAQVAVASGPAKSGSELQRKYRLSGRPRPRNFD